ncbi:MAG: C4-type zinc ribbon domain-containing protein [Bacteroidales bacterium]|uniref:zinc ribbon domain-containing protein n=1 Tax=Porphyromonas sp. TaxID=1924944 RepID=UPI002977BB91|nr:C4-type zinc ribbon domain-containing protein [Porphyromonas sp.]MDD7437364.1 C4-type zinc ribbon domain-containing protein [Bacteroidales bacterium]MDY3067043.1 C4-type zinc ribbon domain-containing protein [Porphyromonas sp.]
MAKKKEENPKEISVEERLTALYQLQVVSSEIDRIRTVRGELPLEVQELADNLEGKKTRMERFEEQIARNKRNEDQANENIRTAKGMIEKYKQHLNDVRNDKEYDAISKELENLDLDVLKYEKAIREYKEDSKFVMEDIEALKVEFGEAQSVYDSKKKELDDIIADTRSEEERLRIKAKELEEVIDSRLLSAFKRTRKSTHNGLAVAPIERNACSGCFNLIPPQRVIDVRSHKKIIACEYCGRVLIDEELAAEVASNLKF